MPYTRFLSLSLKSDTEFKICNIGSSKGAGERCPGSHDRSYEILDFSIKYGLKFCCCGSECAVGMRTVAKNSKVICQEVSL